MVRLCGRETEMMEGGGADEMGFSSTIKGGSNGKSDGDGKCRRQWPCQYDGDRESFFVILL